MLLNEYSDQLELQMDLSGRGKGIYLIEIADDEGKRSIHRRIIDQ